MPFIADLVHVVGLKFPDQRDKERTHYYDENIQWNPQFEIIAETIASGTVDQ